MNDPTKKLLFDVIESSRAVAEWRRNRTFSDYESDRQFRRAVERELEIIGEALNRLTRIDPATAAQIEELPRIIAFRNRVIHGYDSVDDAAVWGMIERKLPTLNATALRLMKDAGEEV